MPFVFFLDFEINIFSSYQVEDVEEGEKAEQICKSRSEFDTVTAAEQDCDTEKIACERYHKIDDLLKISATENFYLIPYHMLAFNQTNRTHDPLVCDILMMPEIEMMVCRTPLTQKAIRGVSPM